MAISISTVSEYERSFILLRDDEKGAEFLARKIGREERDRVRSHTTIVDFVDEEFIGIYCEDRHGYSSDEFISYIDRYMEDVIRSSNLTGGYIRASIPGYISFETYTAIGNMVFGLSADEYTSPETKNKVYTLLWEFSF